MDHQKSTILSVFGTLSLGGVEGTQIEKIKIDELDINVPISWTHRIQNTSKNSYLYAHQSRITYQSLLWDTLYIYFFLTNIFCYVAWRWYIWRISTLGKVWAGRENVFEGRQGESPANLTQIVQVLVRKRLQKKIKV